MNKPFEFDTEDDFIKMLDDLFQRDVFNISSIARASADLIERLINKRGKVVGKHGFNPVRDDWWSEEPVPDEDFTHKALLICPRPIEPEKPECEHKRGWYVEIHNLRTHPSTKTLKETCPKCETILE